MACVPPAAAHTEKSGSFTNTQRMLQWHHQAVEPAGDARSELWFMYHLGRILREKLAGSTDQMDQPLLDLTWDYPATGQRAEPDAEAVLAEINGFDANGEPLTSYEQLPDLLYGQQRNPVRQVLSYKHPGNRMQPSGGQPGTELFPYVATTYQLTEHHTAGGMSRWLPYLAELQPAFFCEVSPELAAQRGLRHLGWATIITARNVIEARVLVTSRITPLTVQGRTLHQVGIPYH